MACSSCGGNRRANRIGTGLAPEGAVQLGTSGVRYRVMDRDGNPVLKDEDGKAKVFDSDLLARHAWQANGRVGSVQAFWLE